MNGVTPQSDRSSSQSAVDYRRLSKRVVPPEGLVVVSTNGDKPKVLNVSPGGMLIHSSASYLPGRIHEFTGHLRDRSFSVRARVVHATAFRSEGRSVLVGLEFTTPLSGDLQLALGIV